MLDWQQLATRANADGEFLINARFWDALVRIDDDSGSTALHIRDGQIAETDACRPEQAADLCIRASSEDWRALLALTPQPFYQDLYAASLHHGFEIHGPSKHQHAYYPALRRLVELMRETHNA